MRPLAKPALAKPRDWAPNAHPIPQAPWAETFQAVVEELTDPESPRRLTQASATVDARTLRTAIAEAAQGRVPGTAVDALVEAVTADPALVPLLHGLLWTSRPTEQAEQAALAAVAAHPRDSARALPKRLVASSRHIPAYLPPCNRGNHFKVIRGGFYADAHGVVRSNCVVTVKHLISLMELLPTACRSD